VLLVRLSAGSRVIYGSRAQVPHNINRMRHTQCGSLAESEGLPARAGSRLRPAYALLSHRMSSDVARSRM